MAFPDGFWWGTAASSTQAEGAAPESDWIALEQLGVVPPSGSGNGFATRFAGDFALYAADGLTHHRLSIEWARIEPKEGQRDARAIEHYLAVLDAARAAGISPWVVFGWKPINEPNHYAGIYAQAGRQPADRDWEKVFALYGATLLAQRDAWRELRGTRASVRLFQQFVP